jgi:hypothetical protein
MDRRVMDGRADLFGWVRPMEMLQIGSLLHVGAEIDTWCRRLGSQW